VSGELDWRVGACAALLWLAGGASTQEAALPAGGDPAAAQQAAALESAAGGAQSPRFAEPQAREAAARSAAERSTAQVLGDAVAAAEGGDRANALALLEVLAQRVDLAPERELERAGVDLALALVLLTQEPSLTVLEEPYAAPDEEQRARLDWARAALHRVRATAGEGELRRRAVYALGTVELWLAERELRHFVTSAQQPGGGAAPAPGAAPTEAPPDPRAALEALLAQFVVARDLLVERVRLDWREADPRANLEWAQRRIRELERALRELDEQEQEQQQEQQEQEEQQQEQQPQEQPQDDSSSDEQQPQEQPSDPSDSPTEPTAQESPPEDAAQEPPQPEPAAPEPGETDPQAAEESDATAEADEELSREELIELLDRLQRIEELGEALRAQLRQHQRQPVDRDW
jgi:hypothetical protein